MSKVPKITIPLTPIILEGEDEPIDTFKFKPKDSLNLDFLTNELKKSIIYTEYIKNHPWSVISTVSPYSYDFNVMIMETSNNRYLPSMEYIANDEGDLLMDLWIKIVEFMKTRFYDQRILLGYNWSPRAWGDIEEKGGFQSIPTKWHLMFFTWPEFNEETMKSNKYLELVDEDSDDCSIVKRLNGDNNFSKDIISQLKGELDKIKNNHNSKIISSGKSYYEDGGYVIKFNSSLINLLKTDYFFSEFLKPIASYLNKYFADLTDVFINEDKLNNFCNENLSKSEDIFSNSYSKIIDNILNKISDGILSDEEYDFLKKLAPLNDDETIKNSLKNKGFSKEAIDELLSIVKNRYFLKSENLWRKGFAYAFVIEENNNITDLKILPAAYKGPGGVIEAKKVIFKRPQDYNLPINDLKNRSKNVYALAKELSKNKN